MRPILLGGGSRLSWPLQTHSPENRSGGTLRRCVGRDSRRTDAGVRGESRQQLSGIGFSHRRRDRNAGGHRAHRRSDQPHRGIAGRLARVRVEAVHEPDCGDRQRHAHRDRPDLTGQLPVGGGGVAGRHAALRRDGGRHSDHRHHITCQRGHDCRGRFESRHQTVGRWQPPLCHRLQQRQHAARRRYDDAGRHQHRARRPSPVRRHLEPVGHDHLRVELLRRHRDRARRGDAGGRDDHCRRRSAIRDGRDGRRCDAVRREFRQRDQCGIDRHEHGRHNPTPYGNPD